VHIYPTVSGLTLSGNVAAPLIDFNGADNVRLDGRLNGAGVLKDLTISNTSISSTAGTSTIRLYNGVSTNRIEYCTIKGSTLVTVPEGQANEPVPASGVIFISEATAGANTACVIDNNNITNAGGNRPLSAIYSATTVNTTNAITISNNNIYDFLNPKYVSSGIFLNYGTTGCTVSNNNLYEISPLVNTQAIPGFDNLYDGMDGHILIRLGNLTEKVQLKYAGEGHTISGNFLGGNAPGCVGMFTKTGSDTKFNALYVRVKDGGIPTLVTDNTIKNISWTNSTLQDATFTGINANAGTINVINNTIGASTGTGSITLTSGRNNTNMRGIVISSGVNVTCQTNTVGSLTAVNTNATMASNVYGRNHHH